MIGLSIALTGLVLAGGPQRAAQAPPERPVTETTLRVTFAERDGRALEGVQRGLPESSPPLDGFTLYERLPTRTRKLAERVGAAAYLSDGRILLVQNEELRVLEGEKASLVADRAAPDFAIDAEGSRVALVRLGAPGQGTGIDLVPLEGGEPKRLVPPEGTNGAPIFTPDGKAVVFLSSRTGIASFFRVGADGAGLRQLTNRGIRSAQGGSFGPGFVPPVETREGMRFVDARTLEYRGAGGPWRLDVESGEARRVEGEGR